MSCSNRKLRHYYLVVRKGIAQADGKKQVKTEWTGHYQKKEARKE